MSADPLLSGSISVYRTQSGGVSMISCDVDSATGAQSPITKFCTGIAYTGADPTSATLWMQSFFATGDAGSELSADRAGLHWSLNINQYQPVILDYTVLVYPRYSKAATQEWNNCRV